MISRKDELSMAVKTSQDEKRIYKKMITQSTVIDMGFTKAMINKLLPPPIERPNPYYKNAAPMKLFVESDVLNVMESAEYKTELEKAKKRKAAAQKGTETKKENLKNLLKEIAETIDVEILSEKELIENTLEKQKAYLIEKKEHDLLYLEDRRDKYEEFCKVYDELNHLKSVGLHKPSEEALARMVVNYIRHNLTTYDYDLYVLRHKAGQDEAYKVLKTAVLRKIALAYPKYKDECEHQIKELYYW